MLLVRVRWFDGAGSEFGPAGAKIFAGGLHSALCQLIYAGE
jgi:hypothetical protein